MVQGSGKRKRDAEVAAEVAPKAPKAAAAVGTEGAQRKAAKRPRALAPTDSNAASMPAASGKGNAAPAKPAPAAAPKDEFDVPSTESGALFSAEELNALGSGSAAAVHTRPMSLLRLITCCMICGSTKAVLK